MACSYTIAGKDTGAKYRKKTTVALSVFNSQMNKTLINALSIF